MLVLLHSPLTSRSTRVAAEKSMLALMEAALPPTFEPFDTVWLGYHLPITTPRERERPEYAFRDAANSDRFNYFKCIWTHQML